MVTKTLLAEWRKTCLSAQGGRPDSLFPFSPLIDSLSGGFMISGDRFQMIEWSAPSLHKNLV